MSNNYSNLIFFGRRLHKLRDKDLIELITERDTLLRQLEVAKEAMKRAKSFIVICHDDDHRAISILEIALAEIERLEKEARNV